MEDAKKQEELQRTVAQIEAGKRQMESIAKQMQAIEAMIAEVNTTQEALAAIKENKKGVEILVPLGSDSYAKATLSDTEHVLVGAGAGISVEKTIPGAEETLKQRLADAEKSMEALKRAATDLNAQLAKLDHDAGHLVEDLKKE